MSAGPAVYKGVAQSVIGSDHYLYAANFASGAIDVLKGSVAAPSLTGTFADPNLPSGYAPFNIQNLGGKLYVTYAAQGAGKDELDGLGLGIVDSFDLNGNLLARVATGGALNAPWGLTFAPVGFGDFAGELLVGNFGDGRINRYDPLSFAYLGQVQAAGGGALAIDGLWALAVGNGGSGGSKQNIYFTAGPDGESHGLFGVLTAVPEPSSWALMIGGFAMTGAAMRRRAQPALMRA